MPRVTDRPNTNFVGSAIDALFRPDSPEVKANRMAQAQAEGLAPVTAGAPTVGQYAGELNAGLMGAFGDEQGAANALHRAQQAPATSPAVTDQEVQNMLSKGATPAPGTEADKSNFVEPALQTDALAMDVAKEVDNAQNAYQAHMGQLFGAEAQRDTEIAKVYGAEALRQQAAIDTHLKNEKIRQETMDASFKQYDDEVKAFKNIPDVDPDRIFGKGITAKRITSTIALALGAFGASYNGGHNYAMNMLQDQIRNDIDAQKANIDKGNMNVRNQASLYELNLRRTRDEAQAEALTNSMYLEFAKTNIAKITAESNSKVTQAKGKVFIDQINMQQAEQKAKYAQRAQVLRDGNNLADEIDMRAELFGGDDKVGKRKLKTNAFADVEKIRTVAKSRREILDSLKEIRKLSVVDRANPLSKNYTKIQGFGVLISGVVSQMQKGPMSDQDAARILAPVIPKLTTYINKGQFDELESVISRALDSQEKSLSGALQQLRLDPEKIKMREQDPNAGMFKKTDK